MDSFQEGSCDLPYSDCACVAGLSSMRLVQGLQRLQIQVVSGMPAEDELLWRPSPLY